MPVQSIPHPKRMRSSYGDRVGDPGVGTGADFPHPTHIIAATRLMGGCTIRDVIRIRLGMPVEADHDLAARSLHRTIHARGNGTIRIFHHANVQVRILLLKGGNRCPRTVR